jgi:hypothetical protein
MYCSSLTCDYFGGRFFLNHKPGERVSLPTPCTFGERHMTDDKTKIGNPDRRTVSASEDYELRYFARKHNIPLAEARRLIKVHGNDRERLEAAVVATGK